MNDQSFMHSVVPVIRWIDDRQQQRQRPIIYIGIETLRAKSEKCLPAASAQKAVRLLIEHYQVYFVCPPEDYTSTTSWLEQYINVPAWRHTIFTHRRDLLYGDYLIRGQRSEVRGQSERDDDDYMATLLEYGSDTFKTWDDIIEYFSRLGGQ